MHLKDSKERLLLENFPALPSTDIPWLLDGETMLILLPLVFSVSSPTALLENSNPLPIPWFVLNSVSDSMTLITLD